MSNQRTPALEAIVLTEHTVRNGGSAVDDAHPAVRATRDRETSEGSERPFHALAPYYSRAGPPVGVDGGHLGTAGAAHRDLLAEEVDPLFVRPWRDNDLIAVYGGVDGLLDCGEVARNVDDVGPRCRDEDDR